MRKLVTKQIGTISFFLALILALSMIYNVSAESPKLGNNNYFLHSNKFLNTTAPNTSIVKFMGSPGVDFHRGNLWKEIGTWKTSPTNASLTLTELSSLHVWIGLKNSDDIGTQFDLRADILKKNSSSNDSMIVTGLTRCITGVPRNPNKAKEVVVNFSDIPDVGFATGDVLALRLSTRIGTTLSGAKCFGPGGSHRSAVGIYVYYDALSRTSRFDATFTSPIGPPPPPPPP